MKMTRRWISWVTLGLLAEVAGACTDYCGSGGGPQYPSGTGPVVRGPQLALVTPTSVLIAWITREPSEGEVEYGMDPELGSRSSVAPRSDEHAVTLEGLLPGTLYHYQVLVDGTVESADHTFQTAPADDSTPFRCVVFGDSGDGSKAQRLVASEVLSASPDLVLIPGDVVYDCGQVENLDPHYFVPYAGLLDHIPFYPVLGNHDVKTQGGKPLLDALYLPQNDQDGTERFYSFDYGNAHFAGLDSNSATAPENGQAMWLDRDLAASTATWKFVYFHHPPFSSSSHGSNMRLRELLEPILERHDVDLVLTGHDHDYERTFPLREAQVVDAGEEPNYIDPRGTVYVVTGGGGKNLYGRGKSYFTAYSEAIHHLTRLDVSGLTLTLTAIREDGSVMDRMTITKTPGAGRPDHQPSVSRAPDPGPMGLEAVAR
jgi:3',5'-cyclic AMP phosphodiesterase CpdA